jgi:hypothetical protein
VGDDPKNIRELLLEEGNRFSMVGVKLVFKETSVPVELLRGGASMPLKLLDANTALVISINPADVENGRPDREGKSFQPSVSGFCNFLLTKLTQYPSFIPAFWSS